MIWIRIGYGPKGILWTGSDVNLFLERTMEKLTMILSTHGPSRLLQQQFW